MKSVFILWHTHESKFSTDEKLIGVYESADQAEQAARRLRLKDGFKDSPDGFEISEYTLGKDHWTDGYISEGEA